ncbi:hypothetical protein D3C73_1137310 [compost metagenome]
MLGRALVHGLHWYRLNGNPLRCFCFGGSCLRLGAAGRNVEQFCELVAGLDVGAAVQIAHQINQVAALVAGGKVGPCAFAQIDLERTGALIAASRIRSGVFLASVDALAVGQPVRQDTINVT